jgi:hypothetical protein
MVNLSFGHIDFGRLLASSPADAHQRQLTMPNQRQFDFWKMFSSSSYFLR